LNPAKKKYSKILETTGQSIKKKVISNGC